MIIETVHTGKVEITAVLLPMNMASVKNNILRYLVDDVSGSDGDPG